MRIMGLDVGDRTVGISVSDPTGMIAQGVDTIRRSNLAKDLTDIAEYCRSYEVEKIVVGLPKNMNGTMGPQSQKVLDFCEELKKVIDLEIVMWDERLTTVAANRAMLEADFSRAKRKKLVDKVAAGYILQGYLDSVSRK